MGTDADLLGSCQVNNYEYSYVLGDSGVDVPGMRLEDWIAGRRNSEYDIRELFTEVLREEIRRVDVFQHQSIVGKWLRASLEGLSILNQPAGS